MFTYEPVIDFGAHYYPEDVDTSNRPGTSVEERTGYDRIHDLNTQITEMDDAGVDAMVHSMPYFLGHEDADRTAKANDVLLGDVNSHEEFYGLASIPIAAGGDAAATEFERCLDDGFHGGAVDETDIDLLDEQFEPVLEVADRTGAVIFVHVPHLPNVDYRLNATLGREHRLAESISRVVHSGLLDSYPNLKLVYHHLGGNIASMMGRIHLHADENRWPGQESMKTFDMFKRQLENRIYIDTCGFFGYHTPIRTALEEFPASQLLFGTDYPWEPRSADEISKFTEVITESTSKEAAADILGRNALDLLVNVE